MLTVVAHEMNFLFSRQVHYIAFKCFSTSSATMARNSVTDWSQSGMYNTSIPVPTGKHEVGCVDLMHRDLLVRMFYPTDPGLIGVHEYTQWLSNSMYAHGFIDFLNSILPDIGKPSVESLMSPKIPALYGAPLILGQTYHPVVIFSHGMGCNGCLYSSISSDLASHGYVVAALEHRDQSACTSLRRVPGAGVPEGQFDKYIDEWIPFLKIGENDKVFSIRNRQIQQRSQEARKALDLLQILHLGDPVQNMTGEKFDFSQFKNRLNMNMACMSGHSFGGGTVVQTLIEDKRFKCGIGLDSWLDPIHRDLYKEEIDQPLLFINSYTFQYPKNVSNMMKFVKPANERGISECSYLTIRESIHEHYFDLPFVIPRFGKANIESKVVHDLTMDLYHSFLRRFLIKDPVYKDHIPNLDRGDEASKHIIFGSNVEWKKDGIINIAAIYSYGLQPPGNIYKHKSNLEKYYEGCGLESRVSATMASKSVADWRQSGMYKDTSIPVPTGKHEVGCVDLMHRDLLVRMFYPTDPGLTGVHEYTQWLPNSMYAQGFIDFASSILRPDIRKPSVESLMSPKIPALYGAPLIFGQTYHPVVVFSHGVGCNRCLYSSISSDLASHGYVVAALEHRDQSACASLRRVPGAGVPEGQFDKYIDEWIPFLKIEFDKGFPIWNRQIQQRSQEACKALDLLQILHLGDPVQNMTGEKFDFSQFKNRLNMNMACMSGHSFGGATVVQTLIEDKRFKCGIALDSWLDSIHQDLYKEKIDQPLLFINSYTFQYPKNVSNMMKFVKPANERGISECSYLTIRESIHEHYFDVPFVIPRFGKANIESKVVHDLTMDLYHSFLRRFLIKDPVYKDHIPNLDGGDEASKHIIFGSNVEWKKDDN